MIDTQNTLLIRWLGQQEYVSTWSRMQDFTNARGNDTPDEIWFLEHPPVFTQGQNGKPEHVIDPGHIPIIKTDRGGQVTYHGPGQLMAYTLIDVKRKGLTTRAFVSCLENVIVAYLNQLGIAAYAQKDAPGVYIAAQKICSIGLRIRKGFAYHGIAFNIHPDLSPFTRINPCGFNNLKMTALQLHAPYLTDIKTVANDLTNFFVKELSYTHKTWIDDNG